MELIQNRSAEYLARPETFELMKTISKNDVGIVAIEFSQKAVESVLRSMNPVNDSHTVKLVPGILPANSGVEVALKAGRENSLEIPESE